MDQSVPLPGAVPDGPAGRGADADARGSAAAHGAVPRPRRRPHRGLARRLLRPTPSATSSSTPSTRASRSAARREPPRRPRRRRGRRRDLPGARPALAVPAPAPRPGRRADRRRRPARDRLRRPVHGAHLGARTSSRCSWRSTARDGKVVLATTEANERGETKILGGDAVLKEVGARPGNGVLLPDPGGVERRVPHSVDKLETLAVASAEVALGRQVSRGRLRRPRRHRLDRLLRPAGDDQERARSRAWSRARRRRASFKDKLVVIGPSAPSLQDVHPTSTTGDDELMAGAEIQASALDTVRRGLPLQSAPRWLDVAADRAARHGRPGGAACASRRSAGHRARPGGGGVFVVAAQLAFNGGTIIAVRLPARRARARRPSARSRSTT